MLISGCAKDLGRASEGLTAVAALFFLLSMSGDLGWPPAALAPLFRPSPSCLAPSTYQPRLKNVFGLSDQKTKLVRFYMNATNGCLGLHLIGDNHILVCIPQLGINSRQLCHQV